MIHTARKLFALLLIAAFTAGFAQPLVWCVSGSDHSRIEFKISGNGHDASIPQPAPKEVGNRASPEWQLVSYGCVDRDAFPQAIESATTDPTATVAPTPDSLRWGVLPQVRAPASLVVATFLLEPRSFHAATSQLDHIRTVILLT